MDHPIDSIRWLPVDDLRANCYNPNYVQAPEMRLLRDSILAQGWIQPILVTPDLEIIDGFHRATLARTDPDVRAMTDGKVPCATLYLSEAERKMLTVRINRAKGAHASVKMHELVSSLVADGATVDQIMAGIGATRDEVQLLLQAGVFKALKIDSHQYSRAWVPK